MYVSRAVAVSAALFLCACGDQPEGTADDQGTLRDTAVETATDTQAVMVADAGLATPESVLHDEDADVYLVSNINGSPLEKDGNGFISRISPDGAVEDLRWIDGEADGVTLHAPKGMAVRGDTLFVSDIDSVRAFSRTSGEYHGARGVPGATFLNDLAVGGDGTLYVSDSGLNADFSSSGTDAVYRFDGDAAVAIAEGAQLSGPNGLAAYDRSLAVVSFAAAEVRRIDVGADVAVAADTAVPTLIATLPGGQLDGIVRLSDGSFLVSSWETQSVYRIPAGAESDQPGDAQREAEVVVEGIPSPADIGFDAQRGRVLIPVFEEDRLEFRPIAGGR